MRRLSLRAALAAALTVACWLGALVPATAQPLPVPLYPALAAANLCPTASVCLDFVHNRYKVGGVKATTVTTLPGWSFSRSTGKYALTSSGVLASFAAGAPAITDLGFWPEVAGTNLLLQSQFGGTSWINDNGNTTTTTGAATAPDGTTTATKIADATTTNTTHYLRQSYTWSSGTFTFSLYVKAAEYAYVMLSTFDGTNDSGYVFNIQAGTLVGARTDGTSPIAPTSQGVQALGSGWFRVWITRSTTSASGQVVALQIVPLATAVTTTARVGVVGSGILVWGAQLEQAAAASSYVPTTTAAATRAADVASLTYSPNGSAATLLYGANSSASPSPASPINLGASSGGAWVGSNIKSLTVTP